MPDLEGVESARSVALVSLEAARKSRRSALGVTFGGLPGRGALENRSWPVFLFSRRMIPATVALVRSVRRPISLYVFPALYQVHTSARFSLVVSRREVIGSEGISIEIGENMNFWKKYSMWGGGGVRKPF